MLVDESDVGDVRLAVDAVRAKHVQTGEVRSKKLAKNLDRFGACLKTWRQTTCSSDGVRTGVFF